MTPCRLSAVFAFSALFAAEGGAAIQSAAGNHVDESGDSRQDTQKACLLQVGASRGDKVTAQPHVKSKRILVEVYYETQCPFCANFLNTTLRLIWDDEKLRETMDLKLYPFGNARYYPESMVSRGYHFWHPHALYPLMMCQHGESECLGNRIHACAMDILQDSAKYVPFIICTASYPEGTGVELSSYECGKKLGISKMNSIKKCAQSQKGIDLMTSAGDATITTNISHVPFVMVDGNHTEDDTVLMPLCALLPQPKPKACPDAEEEKVPGKNKKEKGGGSGNCLLHKHPPYKN